MHLTHSLKVHVLDNYVSGAEVDESFAGVVVSKDALKQLHQAIFAIVAVNHSGVGLHDLVARSESSSAVLAAHVGLELSLVARSDVNHLLVGHSAQTGTTNTGSNASDTTVLLGVSFLVVAVFSRA